MDGDILIDLLLDYIRPELMVLVFALYLIGTQLKKSEYVKDELIPFILTGISIILCAIYIPGVTDLTGGYKSIFVMIFDIIVQGIFSAAGSVFIHQIIKQGKLLKKDTK